MTTREEIDLSRFISSAIPEKRRACGGAWRSSQEIKIQHGAEPRVYDCSFVNCPPYWFSEDLVWLGDVDVSLVGWGREEQYLRWRPGWLGRRKADGGRMKHV